MGLVKCLALSAACMAVLSACGGGARETSENSATPSTGAPASGVSFSNPLELNPAPRFSTSSRAVTYDDCFPRFDDVVVGDVVRSTVDTYSPATGIGSIDQTETVTEVTPTTFNGRAAVSVKTDNPPHAGADNVLIPGVESVALILRGGTVTTSTRNYLNDATGTRTIITNTPTLIGDLSAGRTVTPFALGDSATHAFSLDYVNLIAPDFNKRANVTEKVTFIGVEEGTEVRAGKFDYTCVFRREISSSINGETIVSVQDFYTHKWSGVKAVSFADGYPRPLIYQVVSNSAIDRRKSAP